MTVRKEINETSMLLSQDDYSEEYVLPLNILEQSPMIKADHSRSEESLAPTKVIYLRPENQTPKTKKSGNIRSPRAQEINVHKCITMIKDCKNPGGWLLRVLREEIQETLEDLRTHTKIPERYLMAMESDDYDSLPALIYYKGFVTTYLRYLGLDQPDLVHHLGENFKNRIRVK